MNELKIAVMLQNHFSSKGLELYHASTEESLLQFRSGTSILAAYIVKNGGHAAKNELFSLMLKAASRVGSYNQTYLIAPKLYGPTLDVKHLASTGLGLILYDDRGLYEALPAKLFTQIVQNRHQSNKDFNTGLAEIEQLKREIEYLKKDLAALKTEVEKLRERKIVEKAVEPLAPSSTPVYDEGLPAFFKDNPWITVLSRRGADRT